MKAMRKNSLGLAVALLAMAGFVGCSGSTQNQADPGAAAGSSGASAARRSAPARPATITVPAGTDLHVVLDQTISSETAQAGDRFDATMREPVVVGGKTVIPRDARVKGHVSDARASGRLSGVARLALTLDSVEVGGRSYDVQTSTVARAGTSHKKRDIIAIGGGSAVGALIGGIAGGGKGAAIGAAAGAGAGTAGAAATGKKNVALPAEAALLFRLTAPLTVRE
jgi:hypothetical protein